MSDYGEVAGEMPVLDQALRMTVGSAERLGLDARAYFMVRVAALGVPR